jgi:hypothetical protein
MKYKLLVLLILILSYSVTGSAAGNRATVPVSAHLTIISTLAQVNVEPRGMVPGNVKLQVLGEPGSTISIASSNGVAFKGNNAVLNNKGSYSVYIDRTDPKNITVTYN